MFCCWSFFILPSFLFSSYLLSSTILNYFLYVKLYLSLLFLFLHSSFFLASLNDLLFSLLLNNNVLSFSFHSSIFFKSSAFTPFSGIFLLLPYFTWNFTSLLFRLFPNLKLHSIHTALYLLIFYLFRSLIPSIPISLSSVSLFRLGLISID